MDNLTKNISEAPFLRTLLEIASIWIISDIGYYVFLPVLGFGGGYISNPIQISIYYSFWLLLTIFSFRNIYRKWGTVENKLSTYLFAFIACASIVLYLKYILPMFPTVNITGQWISPPELLMATKWYFLPKSMDILLQQLLVVAMILNFDSNGYKLKTISLWCAILFGGAHLMLVFGNGGPIYVTVFTISAIIASFIFPHLILKVKNGFVYSYFLHWLFYAVVIILARIIYI
jgi:hypothetical protein